MGGGGADDTGRGVVLRRVGGEVSRVGRDICIFARGVWRRACVFVRVDGAVGVGPRADSVVRRGAGVLYFIHFPDGARGAADLCPGGRSCDRRDNDIGHAAGGGVFESADGTEDRDAGFHYYFRFFERGGRLGEL